MLVSSFAAMLGSSNTAALDLASNYKTMGDKARADMEADFQGYGLALTRFVIENISVPPEVEKMLDTRSQMGIVGGDMGRFTQFQTAQAIPEAAKSGGAGDFMGMGVGIAMGQQMGGAMAASMSQQRNNSLRRAARRPGARWEILPQCGKSTPAGAKFCPECGAATEQKCPGCGKASDLRTNSARSAVRS